MSTDQPADVARLGHIARAHDLSYPHGHLTGDCDVCTLLAALRQREELLRQRDLLRSEYGALRADYTTVRDTLEERIRQRDARIAALEEDRRILLDWVATAHQSGCLVSLDEDCDCDWPTLPDRALLHGGAE